MRHGPAIRNILALTGALGAWGFLGAAQAAPGAPTVLGNSVAARGLTRIPITGMPSPEADPDAQPGDTFELLWEFSDNPGVQERAWDRFQGPTGITEQFYKSWQNAGTFTARARAVNIRSGALSPWSNELFVEVRDLTFQGPTGPASGHVGHAYTYSVVVDCPHRDPFQVIFDWGDGESVVTVPAPTGARMVVTASHTWNWTGRYRVTALARVPTSLVALPLWFNASVWHSRNGDIGTEVPTMVELTITANNAPPVPTRLLLAPQYTNVNYAILGYGRADADGDQTDFEFDFGDGSTMRTPARRPFFWDGSTNVIVGHIWTAPGTYNVRVRTVDQHGAASPWLARAVTITSQAPLTPAAPMIFQPAFPPAFPQNTLYFRATGTDPDGDNVRLTFDFGDGASSLTNFGASGMVRSAGHTFPRTGTFLVRVRATDVHGVSSAWSLPTIVRFKPPIRWFLFPGKGYGLEKGDVIALPQGARLTPLLK